MKKLLLYASIIFLTILYFDLHAQTKTSNNTYFELRVYHFSNSQQEDILNNFMQNQLIPYLHSSGINNIGVFKSVANDTASDKRFYVFIPFKSFKHWEKYLHRSKLNDPAVYGNNQYANAVNSNPSYTRMETVFLRAFKFMPKLSAVKLKALQSEKIYELRSYESAGERLFQNKVHMFNEGGEIDIFTRLGFNAVFYGEVIHGDKMPNLMYMTSFANMKDRDEHWAAFRIDSAWKTLSAKKEYEKNVSKIEIIFLKSTNYSDL
jgi:hypothetical protein